MTSLLSKAVKRISKLPKNEQDEIAKLIIEEIEDEDSWNKKFKNSQNELQILAEETLCEFKNNKMSLQSYENQINKILILK